MFSSSWFSISFSIKKQKTTKFNLMCQDDILGKRAFKVIYIQKNKKHLYQM